MAGMPGTDCCLWGIFEKHHLVGGGGGSSFPKTYGGPYKLISLDYETTTRIFGFLLPLPPPRKKLLENYRIFLGVRGWHLG
jgi:hypothetical protein